MQVDPKLLLEATHDICSTNGRSSLNSGTTLVAKSMHGGIPGQFILTGSSTPSDDETRHSGAGRFARIQMRPMSLFEIGKSSGAVSLARLFAGTPSRSKDPGLSLDDLIAAMVRGGWPGNRDMTAADARRSNRDSPDRIRRTDIRIIDGVRRDPERVGAVLRCLARHVSTTVSLTTIAQETPVPTRA
jgi:uncharacterized protein